MEYTENCGVKMEIYQIISDYKTVRAMANVRSIRAAVFVHLFYEEQITYYRDYLEGVPDSIDVIILSSKQAILDRFQSDRYIKIRKENRGRDISALLVAAHERIFQYKYICFVHDKQEKSLDDKEYVELWRKNMWDNMLQNAAYICNVLDLFEEDNQLGMLVPLPPHSGDKGVWLRGGWGSTFTQIKKLAEKLGLSTPVCYEAPPFTYSTVFWARTQVLEKLFCQNWNYADFPEEPMRDYGEVNHAVERVLQYVVEDAGYETRIGLSTTFASGFIGQLKQELNRVWDQMGTVFGITNYSELDHYDLRLAAVKQFQKKYSDIYLYGAGKACRDCLKMCSVLDIKPAGILVTDIKDAEASVFGIPIRTIAECTFSHDSGIIITVYQKEYQDEMTAELERRGYSEYMIY